MRIQASGTAPDDSWEMTETGHRSFFQDNLAFRTIVERAQGITFVERIDRAMSVGGLVREYVSPQVTEILGYTQEEFLSISDRRTVLIHDGDQDRVLGALEEGLATGRFSEQYRMVRKDGRVIWIDERSSLVLDEHDRPLTWQGTIQDVSEQKQAEQAHRAGERRFRAIFDGAAVGIARMALDGWIMEANDALAELVGCGRLELLGNYLGTLDEDGGPAEVPEEFARLAAGGIDRYEADRQYRRRDGMPLWCHVAVALIRDEEGLPEFAIAMFEDITARRAAEDELARRAMHDGLTGLPNRDLLLDRLGVALARTARGSGFALMFLDLDGFKGVNDEFGHDAGDRVLIEAARRFRESLRPSDTLARQGGDEFVVLCEDLSTTHDAIAAAERLVHRLEEPIALADGTMVSVGVSIGVTLALDRSRDGERLIRDADTAMYRAKEAGRCRVAFSDAEAIAQELAPS